MKKTNGKMAIGLLIVIAVTTVITVVGNFSVRSKPIEDQGYSDYYEKFGFQPTIIIEGDWKPTSSEWYETLGVDEGIMVEGTVDFRNTLFAVIPEYLWVEGDLYVHSLTEEIPDTVHVGGELVLQGSRVKVLPTVLDVGKVDLGGTEIDELPDGFRMEEGWLDLGGSRVKRIPDGWAIRDIDGRGSQLEYIGEHGYYSDSGYPELMGCLLLDGTEVKDLPKNLHLVSLVIGDAPVRVLPEGLIIEESLDLEGTCVCKLSGGLEVHDDLDLTGTAVTELPPDIRVGRLILTGTSIEIEDVPEGAVRIGNIVK